ncbi:hypothetical protein CesoFtcFv8_010917 [Champsocephalus esox]|uniref:Uncharacterized protein n=1 Tax=Champsocephalus esox TaxID=159716 RepID=A0AAN8GX56_9TELE|nr:hypothetical protein CesoFtcFv8_010917 [Champsocephalus esox]
MAGRGRRKKLAVKYTQKRKPEETEVQEHSTESATRERKARKCKKVGPTKIPERPPEGSRSPQQSEESRQHSPSPRRNRHAESSENEDESASPALPAGKSKPEVGEGDKGKGKAQKENPPPGVSYSFTEAQEEAIAC